MAEAALLAGTTQEGIEALLASGALLFETGKAGGVETRIIRVMDLTDVYPHLRASEPPAPAASSAASSGPAPEPQPATASGIVSNEAAGDPISQAVRASGADRNALIELCQDLETRLDLAERERQASTASLLMAQRRVLELERSEERRPMAWVAAASLGIFGLALAFVAFRVPSTVRAAARAEIEAYQSSFDARAAQMRESLDASMASLATSMGTAMETARREERELLQAEREAQMAQIAALEARLAEARALQAAETEALTKRVTDAAAEQLAADAEVRRQQNEVLEERLRAAEALGASAREALAEERTSSEADRQAFRQRLAETLDRHDEALKGALQRLESATTKPEPPVAKPAQEEPAQEEAPAPWWKRALGDLRR